MVISITEQIIILDESLYEEYTSKKLSIDEALEIAKQIYYNNKEFEFASVKNIENFKIEKN
jgi:transcription termination factor NusB